MIHCAPPPLVFQGKCSSTGQLTGMAIAWRHALLGKLRHPAGPLAIVMVNHPESVALFFALSCFPVPLILLPLELKPWRSAPPLPRTTHLVLSPTLGHLEAEARQLGLAVTVLSTTEVSRDARDDRLSMATPVETIGALPRLSNGRADRRACIALLEKSLERDRAG